MSLDEFTQAVIAFARAHEARGISVVLVLAFGESLAFISLLLPATVGLIGELGIASRDRAGSGPDGGTEGKECRHCSAARRCKGSSSRCVPPADEDLHDLIAERYEHANEQPGLQRVGSAFPANRLLASATLDRLRHNA
jgi:hypothetical protein